MASVTLSHYLLLEVLVISALSLIFCALYVIASCSCAPNDIKLSDFSCLNATIVDNKITTYQRICKVSTHDQIFNMYLSFVGCIYTVWRMLMSAFKLPISPDE